MFKLVLITKIISRNKGGSWLNPLFTLSFFDLLKKKILEELILKSRESRESGQSKSQPLRELFKEKLEKKAQY